MARSDLVPAFIVTSLNTHLAIEVSLSDTITSVKKKFITEHGLFFPEVGRIDIKAFTACWQGKEYRLSETMLISDVLQKERDCFLKTLGVTQLRPHDDTDTGKQPTVCFAGPPEVVNTSLNKKKKRERNVASSSTTTLRPTQSRKVGEEEFQGIEYMRLPRGPATPSEAIDQYTPPITVDYEKIMEERNKSTDESKKKKKNNNKKVEHLTPPLPSRHSSRLASTGRVNYSESRGKKSHEKSDIAVIKELDGRGDTEEHGMVPNELRCHKYSGSGWRCPEQAMPNRKRCFRHSSG